MFRRKPQRPCTLLVVQGRDIYVAATEDETRHLLTGSWAANVPARFPLYNGSGDVLINERHVGAIFPNA